MILLLMAIAIGAGYLLYEYRKLPPDLTGKKADFSMSAKKLAEEFHLNETIAAQNYTGKILEVSGPVKEINREEDLLILGDSSYPLMISCALKPGSEKLISHEVMQVNIVVRGVCTGYLLDVQLNNGVIINKN
ncbi:OB-fold putative lipoprotein [Flavihumibacter sediminis]|nr:OB-fold putative lipoprotein [Flavihumibacter sediminis]